MGNCQRSMACICLCQKVVFAAIFHNCDFCIFFDHDQERIKVQFEFQECKCAYSAPRASFPTTAVSQPKSKDQHFWRIWPAAIRVTACPLNAGVWRAKKRRKSFSTDLSIKRLQKRLPLLCLLPLSLSPFFSLVFFFPPTVCVSALLAVRHQ